MLYASDLISQYYPWYHIVANFLRHGQLPHWVPNLYLTGYPLLAEGETGVLSPINSLILVLFPFPVAVNLLFIAYLVIGFVGMLLYLKNLNCDRTSRLLGGIVFVLSGFIISRYFQPAIIFTSLLLPWGMMAINQQKLSWLPIVIYLQFTAGHAQMALISIAGYFVYTLLLSFSIKQFSSYIIRNTLFMILGLGLSAIQLLPTLELYKVSDRNQWDPMIRFTYSLPPSHLITYINPSAFGISNPGDDTGFYQFGGGFWELNLTVWTLPFLLSLLPLFSLRRNTMILYTIWIVFLIASFGGYTPAYRLLAKIPHFPFRAPSRFVLLSTFAASALTCKGFHSLTNKKNLKIKLGLLVTVLVITIAQIYMQLHSYFKINLAPEILSATLTTPLPINTRTVISPQTFIIAFNHGLVITSLSAAILLWARKRFSLQQ